MTHYGIDTIFAILPVVMIISICMITISFVMGMFSSEPRKEEPPKETELVEKKPKTKRKKDEWDI